MHQSEIFPTDGFKDRLTRVQGLRGQPLESSKLLQMLIDMKLPTPADIATEHAFAVGFDRHGLVSSGLLAIVFGRYSPINTPSVSGKRMDGPDEDGPSDPTLSRPAHPRRFRGGHPENGVPKTRDSSHTTTSQTDNPEPVEGCPSSWHSHPSTGSG